MCISQFIMNPYFGHFQHMLPPDPTGVPVDRRPLRLGMFLQHQTFSAPHQSRGATLLTRFKSARYMGWMGMGAMVIGGMVAVVPELVDASMAACQLGAVSGGTTALGGMGVRFFSRIEQDEIAAEMETEFGHLKSLMLQHNTKAETPLPVPYLADPSLAERLAEAHIANQGASTNQTLSQVPGNLAAAGIALEALKTFKGFRKS
jgi:hypothetical protein